VKPADFGPTIRINEKTAVGFARAPAARPREHQITKKSKRRLRRV
jgi:hypothetical protein